MSRSSGGKSSGPAFTLTPIPSTTQCTRSGSAASSVRMPATFRPPDRTSFGHLMPASTPACRSASQMATRDQASARARGWAAARGGG